MSADDPHPATTTTTTTRSRLGRQQAGNGASQLRVRLATVTVNFPTATIVWIVFIIVWQRIEDYIVQPFVYGRALKVNPLVTIISLLVGGELLGLLGVLLAIPSAAAIQIILREWWSTHAAGSAAVQRRSGGL